MNSCVHRVYIVIVNFLKLVEFLLIKKYFIARKKPEKWVFGQFKKSKGVYELLLLHIIDQGVILNTLSGH